MRSFFSKIFSQTLSFILAMVVIFLLLGFLVSYLSLPQKLVLKPQSTLVIDLNMNIVDAPQQKLGWEKIEESISGWNVTEVHLKSIIDAIDKAAKDEKITTLYLQGSLIQSNYGNGFASLRELREAIIRFKEAGKPVIAYLVTPSLRDYYLTSAATTVILHPFGELEFKGLASKSIFLAGALEKYGIDVQILKVGKYKSAIEAFTRQEMSPEDREQTSILIKNIWHSLISDIAESRGKEKEPLLLLAEQYGILSPQQALDVGLIDHIGYFDEVRERLIKLGDYDTLLDSFVQVPLDSYDDSNKESTFLSKANASKAVAVIYAEGDIVNGDSLEKKQIGGDQLSRELRTLRQDNSIQAIVLRINSQGGSAVASELIAREVKLLKESGKHIVVSMGTYAASGGYWIAAPADSIFAEPTTITGSIGIFGLIPNIQTLAQNNGITFDGVKTSKFADIGSIDRPQTNEELALLQKITNFFYTAFIDKVAQGRGLSVDEVKKIAEGRIWSGNDALRIGLIDRIGGLQDAIAEAKKLADLPQDTPVIEYPGWQPMELLELFFNTNRQSPIVEFTDPLTKEFRQWRHIKMLFSKLNDPRHIYARLPFTLTME